MTARPESGVEQATPTLDVRSDGVACLTFDDPDNRHNLLSTAVMRRLDACLDDVVAGARAGTIRALLVRSGKPGSFIAGADVKEIVAIDDPVEATDGSRAGQRIFQRLATLPVPTVAAVNGVCLGGGTEMILACDRRLAADVPATRIGLPEVRLGILPGFGGTTRLPRLVGVRAAAALIVTGKTVSARSAERMGLVDQRVPAELLDEKALALARSLAGEAHDHRPRRRLRFAQRLENSAPGRALVLRMARRQVMAQTHGRYPAPLAALDTMGRGLGMKLEAALELEAAALGQLVVTDVCKNLIHVFFLMESAKRESPEAEPLAVERVGVLGAGTMGGGIAQLLAYRGLSARMKDIRAPALSDGLRHARQLFDRLVARHSLDRRQATQAMERISPALDYSGFGALDLVIEAVVERMDVKKQVLRETEAQVPERCIMATNTSSLSVSEMQEALERPDRFCGMHFFNPVHRMPLVEVVRGRQTSEQALATVFALARRLEKTPIIVNDGPGFLVNRLLAPYLNEAGWLLSDGASIQAVDRALLDFGMPMGPFRLLDEVGLDISRHAGQTMYEAFGERMRPAPPLVALERTGRLGRKGGKGFYLYEDGRQKDVDSAIYDELRPTVPGQVQAIAEADIRDRAVLCMVNEAARVLEEGLVHGPGMVDLGMITGTGFPPFRGGLLRYADAIGLDVVVERLEVLAREVGPRFEPAPPLRELASRDGSFYS